MHLLSISLHQIVQPMWIASCGQEAIARSKNCLRDIAAQTTCATCYQPYFGHQNLRSADWMQRNGVNTH